jgi:hypothetical protein
VVTLLRSIWIRTGTNARQTVLSVGAAVLCTAVLALAATGRLSWIVAVLTAFVPFGRRLAGLLLYAPLLKTLFPRLAARIGQPNPSAAPSDSQHTTTDSPYFRMTLHHESGHMDGEVKLGPFKGRFLSELRLMELVGLLDEVHDYDSQRLLETYLDQHYPEWRQAENSANGGRASGMSRNDALEALALQEGASREEIIAAHRRLIQRLHPDRGGSTYLAALLNQAKDILLRD